MELVVEYYVSESVLSIQLCVHCSLCTNRQVFSSNKYAVCTFAHVIYYHCEISELFSRIYMLSVSRASVVISLHENDYITSSLWPYWPCNIFPIEVSYFLYMPIWVKTSSYIPRFKNYHNSVMTFLAGLIHYKTIYQRMQNICISSQGFLISKELFPLYFNEKWSRVVLLAKHSYNKHFVTYCNSNEKSL